MATCAFLKLRLQARSGFGGPVCDCDHGNGRLLSTSLHFLRINVPTCCILKRTLIFGATFQFPDHQHYFKLFCQLCSAPKASAGVFLALCVLSYRDT